jgi:hypothetical protein
MDTLDMKSGASDIARSRPDTPQGPSPGVKPEADNAADDAWQSLEYWHFCSDGAATRTS